MDFDKLRSFVMVAELGSLLKASENLSVTQSGVSKQISALEKFLGYNLFVQRKKTMMLTEEGEIFLRFAKSMLDELTAGKKALDIHHKTMSGEIVLSTTNSLAALYMSDALKDFFEKFQNVSISIVGSDEETHWVFDKVDVAVRPMVAHPYNFLKRPLMTHEMSLYASQDYIRKYGEVRTKSDLVHHRVISYGEHTYRPYKEINWHMSFLPAAYKPFLSINSGPGMLRAVENGLGIAPLSQMGVKDSKANLIKILPDYPGPRIENYFYYLKTLEESEKVQGLYNHLYEFFRNHNMGV